MTLLLGPVQWSIGLHKFKLISTNVLVLTNYNNKC
jgi:hypothetical protein